MAHPCQVCAHPQIAAIDKLLVESDKSQSEIAEAFGVSPGSVQRHRAEHLPKLLVQAMEAPRIKRGRSILESLDDWQSRVDATMRRLLPDSDLAEPGTVEIESLQAISTFLKTGLDVLALKGKATGELGESINQGAQIAIVIPPV
jgi:hypothetical protein